MKLKKPQEAEFNLIQYQTKVNKHEELKKKKKEEEDNNGDGIFYPLSNPQKEKRKSKYHPIKIADAVYVVNKSKTGEIV